MHKTKLCFALAGMAMALFAAVFLIGVEFIGLPPVKAGRIASLVMVAVMVVIVATRLLDVPVVVMFAIFLAPLLPMQLIELLDPLFICLVLVIMVAFFYNQNWDGIFEGDAILTVLVELAGMAGMVFFHRVIGAWSALFAVAGAAVIGLLWRYHNRAMKLAKQSASTAK